MQDITALVSALPVPDPAPAFDDAALAGRPGPGLPGPPPRPGRTVPPSRSTPADAGPARVPSEPAGPPAGGRWPSLFAQVLAETLTGSRPPAQIARWTTEQARRRISELGPVLAASHQPRIRRVIVSSPAADVIEMAMVVGFGARVHAVAVRLERPAQPTGLAAPWRCTAVEAV